MSRPHLVITTIASPTPKHLAWLDAVSKVYEVVIVGDTKTPAGWQEAPVTWLPVERQYDEFGAFARKCPTNQYSRKNLGYLYAIRQGASRILETDDDNFPYDTFGAMTEPDLLGHVLTGPPWSNVYLHFCDRNSDPLIWPRGLPLDAIREDGELGEELRTHRCPVQQFLVDADPDVDAIWRLIFGNSFSSFRRRQHAVILDKWTFCPFNSQNTLFFPETYPLMYLPGFVSFRMTDIWRSLVVQSALWVTDARVAFLSATAHQQRNQHDLMRDFGEELPGYLSNRAIADVLATESAILAERAVEDRTTIFRTLWMSLVDSQLIPREEVELLELWVDQLGLIRHEPDMP